MCDENFQMYRVSKRQRNQRSNYQLKDHRESKGIPEK